MPSEEICPNFSQEGRNLNQLNSFYLLLHFYSFLVWPNFQNIYMAIQRVEDHYLFHSLPANEGRDSRSRLGLETKGTDR